MCTLSYIILTNIIIGQLNTELYDGDNGIPKFCICENLETHFHLVLFEHWHDTACLKSHKDKPRYSRPPPKGRTVFVLT